MATFTQPTASIFDTIGGLPLHPLVVHAVVVLLPLAALFLLAIIVIPSWRARFGWVTLLGLFAGTGAAFVAKESGEQLAARVGLPKEHAEWGNRLPLVAALLLIVAVVWFVQVRRTSYPAASSSETPAVRSSTARITGALAAVLAVAVVALSVVVGHSGAEAVWASRVTTTSATTATTATSPTSSPSTTGGATQTATGSPTTTKPAITRAAGTYTLAQVKQHASASSCWTAVNGTIYDVTAWISRHPGGQDPILGLCGTDGTKTFSNQHGSQSQPNIYLGTFQIGTLAS